MNSDIQNESDSFYHQLVNEMPLGFAHCEMIFDKGNPIDFVYLAVNKAFYQLTGFGNVIGKRISEIIPDLPSTNAELLEGYGRVALTGQSENFEAEIPAINMWLNTSVQSSQRGHFIAIFENITERKKAEQLIHGSQAELRSILDTIPDYVLNISPDLKIRYINKTYPGVSIEQVKGSPILNWIQPEHRDAYDRMLNKALASNELCELETMGTGVDGRATYYLSRVKAITENGQTTGLIMIGQDMTHRRLYEERLQVSQKLESLGLLAGGIAHDFNNLKGGIFGYIDIAKEILGDQEISKYLAKALNTMERARNLTHQLLTFSKGGSSKQAIGPLFPFVQETVHFILSGADISCSFEHASDLWLCNFDTNQIGQVIDNLFINAKQAMPNGGNIRIRAENFENIGLQKPFLAPGKFAILSVHDSGSGISQNQIAKIFDPFFTTKDKGHGLGLATSYSIVKRHGGLIEVDSEVNKGSVFRVYLPAAHSAVVNEPELILTLHHGQGSILVMDDEIVMRETICDMLQLLGYESFAIENGEQVLDYLQASHTNVPCRAVAA